MILRPNLNLKNIYEIDLVKLKEMGIKALFLDLDSTTMVSKSATFTKETIEWLKIAEKDFYIAIVSNNKNKEYISKVKKQCNYKVVDHANKPAPFKMNKLIKSLFMKPSEVVMVGDRPLTDILAGKLAGCKTILVGSINDNENIPTKAVRFLERLTICPF